jgi:flavin-dependent dehydrogenase
VAARVVRKCLERNDLSSGSLKEYDRQMYRRTGKELRMSAAIHRMAHWTTLFDLVIKKAKKNKAFRNLISSSFNNESQRKKLSSPLSLLSRLLNP